MQCASLPPSYYCCLLLIIWLLIENYDSVSDYAQQFQNQNSNRGKIRDQDVQVSQREQQKKQQLQQQQQNNVFNSAAQDYNEQYHLQVELGSGRMLVIF